MSDAIAATPAEQPGGTSPSAQAANPADNAIQGETVTLAKDEVEQLRRDAARASTAQSKADRYDRLMRNGGSRFKAQTPSAAPSEDEQKLAADEEDRKAEKGLLGLAADPAYRELLDSDTTLRTLLTSNPLAILPVYAPDALDAEDAIALVKEKLSARVDELRRTKAPAGIPEQKPAIPPAPPAGGVNPPSGTTPDAEYEAAKKSPNTERALAGMIKIGLNKLGGK